MKTIVNALISLLATGGSTNHTIHWIAVARAAGILIDWQDFDELSSVVPLLARVSEWYRRCECFPDAGGPSFVIRELVNAGLMHGDVMTVFGKQGLHGHAVTPSLGEDGRVQWDALPEVSGDTSVLRPVAEPFAPTGFALLQG
jgi:phosphogluconate dehydratase